MIHQIAQIKTQTQPLTGFSKGLIQVRHIQSRIKETHRLPLVETLFANRISALVHETSPLWFD